MRRKEPGKIVLLAKTKLNNIEVLISTSLNDIFHVLLIRNLL